jgi:hypothetical protein
LAAFSVATAALIVAARQDQDLEAALERMPAEMVVLAIDKSKELGDQMCGRTPASFVAATAKDKPLSASTAGVGSKPSNMSQRSSSTRAPSPEPFAKQSASS